MTQSRICLQTTIQQFFASVVPHGDQSVLLAVSGGIDSVALLHAAQMAMRGSAAPAAPDDEPSSSVTALRLVVGHVDHGLRSQAGAEDRDWVARLAQDLGLEFLCRSVPRDSIRQQSRGSLEESARSIRYQLLQEMADECSAKFIATAHHRDDQAETVLHNILRGTGLRGLQGMRPVRPLTDRLLLIRPMLSISRAQILDYVTSWGLAYRDDDTNLDLSIMRNRIRHDLLPYLQVGSGRDLCRSLASLAHQAGDAVDWFDRTAEDLLVRAQLELSPDVCRLNRAELQDCPDVLIRNLMTLIWRRQGWPLQDMTARHWHRLSASVTDRADQVKPFDLPGPIHVAIQPDLVRLTRLHSQSLNKNRRHPTG